MNVAVAIILLIFIIVLAIIIITMAESRMTSVEGGKESRTKSVEPSLSPMVAKEYTAWLANESMIRTMSNQIPRESLREFRAILERYLISTHNARATGNDSREIEGKMREELLAKGIARDDRRAEEMVREITKPARAARADRASDPGELTIIGDYVRVGDMFARRVGAERIALLRKRAMAWRGMAASVPSMVDDMIGAMVLRYSSMAPGGQQWSIPESVYDVLHDNHGATFEAFASPLNSQMMRYDDGTFASLFPDVDAPFGSAGSFFDCDLDGKIVVVNPPFTEDVIEAAAERCLKECTKKDAQVCFIIILPHWTNTKYFAPLRSSPYLAEFISIPRGRAYFEHDGREITTTFGVDIFVISAGMRRGKSFDDVVRAFAPGANVYGQLRSREYF